MINRKYYVPPVEKTHVIEGLEPVAPPKKILIVDDDWNLADLIGMMVERHGYLVETARDGVQGIKKIMAGDYSVILCDMVMPNLAGDMFYLAVQRVRPHLCPRFIFMTGHNGDRKVDEFIRRVRGLILWKPFESHILMEAIEGVERKSRQE